MSDSKQFDVAPWMIKFKGQDYLLVAGRIMWLRYDHPEATISTMVEQLSDRLCVIRAEVMLPNGARGCGYGSETPSDFGDFIEKSETKAIGRALATLGYGTNAVDHFEGRDADGELNIVDSPRRPRKPLSNYEQISGPTMHERRVPREALPLPATGPVPQIEGAAPTGLSKLMLIRALNASGWSFPELTRLGEIVQEIEAQYDGERIPGTNIKEKDGKTYRDHWPSDVWNFLAAKAANAS